MVFFIFTLITFIDNFQISRISVEWHDVIIECVRSENVADTLQHLDKLGYNDGPPESAEFGVVDISSSGIPSGTTRPRTL
jgi:hypothetical protein